MCVQHRIECMCLLCTEIFTHHTIITYARISSCSSSSSSSSCSSCFFHCWHYVCYYYEKLFDLDMFVLYYEFCSAFFFFIALLTSFFRATWQKFRIILFVFFHAHTHAFVVWIERANFLYPFVSFVLHIYGDVRHCNLAEQ